MAERRHKRKKVAPGPARALGAPFPIELGDEEFMASPLTLDDFASFENWVKGQRVAQVLRGFEALGDDMTPAQEDRQSRLIQEITTAGLSPMNLVGEMTSMTGALYVIWLSIRHEHPTISLEELRGKVRDSGSVLDVVTKISGLFNETDAVEGKQSADPKEADGPIGKQ